MKNLHLITTALAIGALAIGTLTMGGTTAQAATMTAAIQQDPAAEALARENERRRGLSVTQRTGTALTEVLNLYNAEPPQLQEALDKVNQVLARELNGYDESTAREIRATLYFQLDNPQGSLRDFIRILEIDELPFERLREMRFNVAQIYFQQEDYPQTIRYLRQYIEEDDGAKRDSNVWYILAISYAQLDDYPSARVPAENAVQFDQEQDKKNYELLNLIYSELELTTERVDLLETMLDLFPEEADYWVQLAGIYNILDRERDTFSTLEIAYELGFIDTESQIIALAQYYSRFGNPYRGGKLVEQEMTAGRVRRTLQNLELLSQLWSMAREQRNAIESLGAAARLSESGELYYRLGQSYLMDEQFPRAVENLRAALRQGGLSEKERGDIYLLIGSSLFNIDGETTEGRMAARRAYAEAAKITTSRPTAVLWLQYIDELEETYEALAEVERLQREARRRQEIDRCETIIDVVELGGTMPEEAEQRCRELLAEVEAEEAAAAAAEAAGTDVEDATDPEEGDATASEG